MLINHRIALPATATLCLWFCLTAWAAEPADAKPAKAISQAAADSCEAKVNSLESYSSQSSNRKKRTTRISEEEINSYFTLKLKPKYHPSLKAIQFGFESTGIWSAATIDFDALSMNSTKVFTKLILRMFSGTHQLEMRGKLIADAGKAHFELAEARFDGNGLPNFLVEQVITTVGRKQKPPFDPVQPTQMPWGIQKVEVKEGYILVYQ